MTQTTKLTCACGRVHIGVSRTPIVSVECCCNSCREAGSRLQTLPDSPPVLDTNGATRFVLYRKDRVHFLKGTDLLMEFRLTPEAKTRRVVATCCNTRFPRVEGWSLAQSLWWPLARRNAAPARNADDDG